MSTSEPTNSDFSQMGWRSPLGESYSSPSQASSGGTIEEEEDNLSSRLERQRMEETTPRKRIRVDTQQGLRRASMAAATSSSQGCRLSQGLHNSLFSRVSSDTGLRVSNPYLDSLIDGSPEGTPRSDGRTRRSSDRNQDNSDDEVEVIEIDSDGGDDDLVVLHDKGLNPIYPHEPKRSPEFKEYLLDLRNPKHAGRVINLMWNPPEKLKNTRPKGSCSFVTVDDLLVIHEEIKRTMAKLAEPEQEEFNTSMEMLSLHEHFMSHIVKAKQDCVRSFFKERKEQASIGGTNEFESMLATEHSIGLNLTWHAQILSDVDRNTASASYMMGKLNEGHLTRASPEKKKSVAKRRTSQSQNSFVGYSAIYENVAPFEEIVETEYFSENLRPNVLAQQSQQDSSNGFSNSGSSTQNQYQLDSQRHVGLTDPSVTPPAAHLQETATRIGYPLLDFKDPHWFDKWEHWYTVYRRLGLLMPVPQLTQEQQEMITGISNDHLYFTPSDRLRDESQM